MDMCYDGTLVLPSSYAVMEEEEMMYVEGGGISARDALIWLGGAIFGGIVYDVFKAACIKVGAWAAMNAVAICTVVSRAVAITLLAGIAACYGTMIVKTYKTLLKK